MTAKRLQGNEQESQVAVSQVNTFIRCFIVYFSYVAVSCWLKLSEVTQHEADCAGLWAVPRVPVLLSQLLVRPECIPSRALVFSWCCWVRGAAALILHVLEVYSLLGLSMSPGAGSHSPVPRVAAVTSSDNDTAVTGASSLLSFVSFRALFSQGSAFCSSSRSIYRQW